MKFSDYMFSSEARRSSIMYGLFTGMMIGVVNGWKLGLLTGAVVALLMSVFHPIVSYLRDLPYIKIKKTISTPILIDKRVHFTVKNGVVKGFLLLTAEHMIFLSMDHGDHRLELSRADIQSIKRSDEMTISIFLNETQFVRVISGECEEIVDTLLANGWSVGV